MSKDMKSRYTPLTQQPYCCVPACLQMVMYKHGIPLLPQEDMAYELGLVVPEKDAHMFNKVRTGEKPSSGWGTQIQKEEFSANSFFRSHNVPLDLKRVGTRDFKDKEGLRKLLQGIQVSDRDGLLCFDYGKLWSLDFSGGHVCVFDHIEGDTVHIVDPERNVPKYRQTTLDALFAAMDFHGDHNSTGVWLIEKH